MGRYWPESDGENVADYLWTAWLRRATNGKPGQKFLRELEQALLSMPKRELVSGALVDTSTNTVCAIGALAKHKMNSREWEVFVSILEEDRDDEDDNLLGSSDDSIEIAKSYGAAWSLAYEVGQHNDNLVYGHDIAGRQFCVETPHSSEMYPRRHYVMVNTDEERWWEMFVWTRARIKRAPNEIPPIEVMPASYTIKYQALKRIAETKIDAKNKEAEVCSTATAGSLPA